MNIDAINKLVDPSSPSFFRRHSFFHFPPHLFALSALDKLSAAVLGAQATFDQN